MRTADTVSADDVDRVISALAAYEPNATIGVEYAHLYSNMNGPMDAAEVLGLSVARRVISQAAKYGLGCSTLIMVDDYSVEITGLAPEEAEPLVKAAGGPTPDGVVRESALADLVEPVLAGITRRSTSRSIRHWHRDTGRWPCSALVASWYLYRLGAGPFEAEEHALADLRGEPVPRSASILVNVLADKHQESEQRAAAIIAESIWADAGHRVHSVYYPSAVGPERFRSPSTGI